MPTAPIAASDTKAWPVWIVCCSGIRSVAGQLGAHVLASSLYFALAEPSAAAPMIVNSSVPPPAIALYTGKRRGAEEVEVERDDGPDQRRNRLGAGWRAVCAGRQDWRRVLTYLFL